MVISKANGIYFSQVQMTTANWIPLQTFDNRLPYAEQHRSYYAQSEESYYLKGETLMIQVMTDLTETFTVTADPGLTIGTPAIMVITADIRIWQYSVTFTDEGHYNIEMLTSTERYISECIRVLDINIRGAMTIGLVKLEWFNYDNAFTMDFSTAIVPFCWTPGALLEWQPKLESEIFQNNEETIKLKEYYQRQINAVFTPISRRTAEKLVIASAMDKFFCNEEEFVREEGAEVAMLSNMVELKMLLTDRNVLGLNTHDIGVETDVLSNMTLSFELQDTSFTTSVLPSGWIIHMIRFQLVTGDGINLAVGDLPAGTDIVYTVGPNDAPIVSIDNTVHKAVDALTDGTVNVTISGTNPVVNVYIDLFNGNA